MTLPTSLTTILLVSSSEAQSNATAQARGFVFTAYQSSLSKGFVELQVAWANNVNGRLGYTAPLGYDAKRAACSP